MGISIQDIYVRNEHEHDPSYQNNIITYSDELEQTISMVKMILTTRKGEILGDPEFGVSIEDQIFTLNVSLTQIENDIRYQIAKYITISNPTYEIDVNASYVQGITRDAVYIDVLFNHQKLLGILVK